MYIKHNAVIPISLWTIPYTISDFTKSLLLIPLDITKNVENCSMLNK